MRIGFKTAAAIAALGIASFYSVPNVQAMPADDDMKMATTTIHTAEIVGDSTDDTGTRVISVRMPDGEQFVIRDWSAGTGSVRRITHRDFDHDGDLEVRVAMRDGRVVEVDEDDVEFDTVNPDAIALIAEDDGDIIYTPMVATGLRETEFSDTNAYRDSGDVDPGETKVDDDGDGFKSKVDADTDVDVDVDHHDMDMKDSKETIVVDPLPADDVELKTETKVDDDGDGFSSDSDSSAVPQRESEFLPNTIDDQMIESDSVNSYRSADTTIVLTEPSPTPENVVDEVTDKTEDAWDMTKDAADEAADKTEDAWDATKDAADEAADKVEDATEIVVDPLP